MRRPLLALSAILLAASGLRAAEPVLKRSDVVFMYQADVATYQQYNATVLAWGGKPTAQSKAAAQQAGVKFLGSVGMVTEFARYYERFPETYDEGLCRDVFGQPVKVPWLTDHQHKGIPFWWCCTHQPQFRQYLRERVVETVEAGADGVHMDDHMGTSGGLWLGICFCDRCVHGFQTYLASLPPDELHALGIEQTTAYDYRAVLRQWLSDSESDQANTVTRHPLWNQWSIYQVRSAAAFMQELRELAATTAGRPLPIGANAGLLWPRHLADYQAIDLFSAETDHHAAGLKFTDLPLVAYRMADAVDRPYAATASGGDWAFIKEHDRPGLVGGWIALSYAAGHCFMVPHRQWCYTPEKGTHWYQGPAEKFATLYQFVRNNAQLLDGYATYADVAVVMPYASFVKDPGRWFDLCGQLAAANVSYRLVLAGDALVDHPLTPELLAECPRLLIPQQEGLLPADRQLVEQYAAQRRTFTTAAEALSAIKPAVRVDDDQPVRVLSRVQSGSAVVHLLNYAYDAQQDDVTPLTEVEVEVDLAALGVPTATTCNFVAIDGTSLTLPIVDGRVVVPQLGLWGLLAF